MLTYVNFLDGPFNWYPEYVLILSIVNTFMAEEISKFVKKMLATQGEGNLGITLLVAFIFRER